MDKKIVFVFAILILGVFFVEDVNAQIFSGGKGTANYVNYGSSFERYYGSDLKTYWPVLANKESCEARQDILIQVSPAGCQPAVVRSDLLAEQNVPVFCQLDALQLNPTIDVKQIRNIRFSGDYPPEIAGIGFHPARAALRTGDRLLGSPLESNIGYVVVVLKRNPNEAEMPEFLEFSVNAQIDYYSGNALGIGRTEFLLQETTEDEWKLQSNKQSFFNGDYSVRLLDTDKEFIDVAIYLGDKRISTTRVERRGSNPEVYLPGHYCQTALDLDYVELISPEDIARIQVGDDVIDVYAGSSFLNNKCSVRKIDSDVLGGKVEIVCGNEKAILTTKIRILQVGTEINYFEGRDDLGLWEITAVNENGRYDLEEVKGDGKRAGIVLDSFRPASGEEFVMDKAYPTSDVYFYSSIGNYSFTADSYGNEKKNEGVQKTIGEEALERAINLALSAGKDASVARLIEEYLRLYPNGNRAGYFNQRLNDLYYRDSSLAGTVVNIDNEFKVIKLLDVKKPEKKSSAKIVWGAQTEEIFTGGTKEFGGRKVTLINVKSEDEVDVEVSCFNEAQNKEEKNKKRTLRLGEAGEIACGDGILKVNDVNFEEYVKLRINPVTRTGGLTNFSVGVGIEKRAIELTPEKAKKKISNLDESIKEWESISNTLGNVVTGLKGACFATAGVLTVKNFFTGLSGEALARQQVMRGDDGWTKKCEQMLSTNGGQYSSLGACYNANADEIKRDVNARAKAIKETNVLLEGIEDRATISEGGIFGGDNFDDEKAKKELLDEINREFGDVKLDNNRVGVNNLGKLLEGVDAKSLTYSQLRDIYTNSLIINGVGDGGSTKVGKEKAEAELNTMAVSIKESLDFAERAKSSGVSAFIIGNRNVGNYFGGTVASYRGKGYDLSSLNGKVNDNTKVQLVQGKREYIVVLDEGGKNVDGVYVVNNKVVEVTDISNGSGLSGSQEEELGNIPRTYNLVTSNSYSNTFAPGEAKVRYFEREPYKGMPAVVPFDLNNGFYVATKQTLPLLGNTASYESNGRPASFWVCNVMQDLKIGFASSNFGDDQCVQFNFYTGQSFSNFPALSESETKTLVGQAVKALQEAAEQYKAGVKQVRILGQTMQVGNSMAIIPGTQCQDYMSPGDCNLLFNVCDPVICPSSRCDFGGAYPVDDVIQSGIVGSVLLCLPNFKENIYVPVCLTGIKAGIDGYLSILKSHKACLEENIESGSYVGICDQITSVYTCEFFWRQAAPLAKFALPKVIEGLSGEGSSRGGGEYLTVASSWQNAEDSIDYFTQSYAVNSIEAFRARSFDEAGTDICRAFVSAKGPNAFETLIEPDSPSQFHAWYSEIPFTDATVPATSQYKVFYHIYSGNDRGVSFSVYLKDPPENVQYHSTDRVVVANGFAPRGEFATETRDFTAPKGYKQLCVRINDKEECGFKQVSSSFAINYVKDVIVKDELLQTGISSESECISGSVNPAALLNPNLQEAVQEAINPEIYRRGIVRVCATANPGIGTDASRYVNVGNCGNERIGCWLDKESATNAITYNNVDLTKTTLSELESLQRNYLKETGVEDDAKINLEIKDIRGSIDGVNNVSKFNEIVVKIKETLDKSFWNYQKAELYFLYGYANEKFFEVMKGSESSVGAGSGGSGAVAGKVVSLEEACKSVVFRLEWEYSEGRRIEIIKDGNPTELYVLDDSIFENRFLRDKRVGAIINDKIVPIFDIGEGSEVAQVLEDIRGRSISDLQNGIEVSDCSGEGSGVTGIFFKIRHYSDFETTGTKDFLKIETAEIGEKIYFRNSEILFVENILAFDDPATLIPNDKLIGHREIGRVVDGKITISISNLAVLENLENQKQITEVIHEILIYLNGKKYTDLVNGMIEVPQNILDLQREYLLDEADSIGVLLINCGQEGIEKARAFSLELSHYEDALQNYPSEVLKVEEIIRALLSRVDECENPN